MLPRCSPAGVRPGRCTANLLLPPALDPGGLMAQKSRDLKVMPPNLTATGNSPLQNKAGSARAVVGDLSLSELLPQRPRCDRKYIQTNVAIPIVIRAAGKGGGVLDRPAEKVSPGRKSEFDAKKSRKMSPPFRVVLHNDNENRREYVVQVLMKVIPGMTVDNAVNIMQEAHVNGMAVVIVCSQPEAEEHCTALRGNGLRSSIEPASGGC